MPSNLAEKNNAKLMACNLQRKPHDFYKQQETQKQQRQVKPKPGTTTALTKKEYIQLNNNYRAKQRNACASTLNAKQAKRQQRVTHTESSYVPAATTPTKSISSGGSSSSSSSSTASTTSTANTTPLSTSLSSSTTTLTYKSLLARMGSCLGRCVPKETTTHIAVTATTTSCWRRQQATDEQEADLMSLQSENNKRDSFIYRIIKFKSKKKSPQFIEKFWEHNDNNYQKLSNKNSNKCTADIQLQNLDVNNLLAKTQCVKESAVNYAGHTSSSRASSSLDLEWEHEYTHMRQFVHQQQQHQQPILVPIHQPHATPQHHTQKDNLINWPYQTQEQTEHTTNALPRPPSATSTATNSLATDQPAMPQRITIRQAVNSIRHAATLSRKNSTHNSWSHISTPESLEWDVDEEQQRQLHTEDDNLDHETLKLLHQIEQLKNQVLHETGDGLAGVADADALAANSTSPNELPADECRHYTVPTNGEIINFS